MRTRAGLAGAVAVALALGVVELVAGLTIAVPSAVDAVGQQVIPLVPVGIERWAIATFGTADVAVLNAGTVTIALLLGAASGLAALRRPGGATPVFVLAAVLGVAASLPVPGAVGPAVVATLAAAVILGLVALRLQLGRLVGAPGHVLGEARGPRPETDVADVDRRGFLRVAAGVGAAAALTAGTGRLLLRDRLAAVDTSLVTLPPPARALPAVPGPATLDVAGLTPLFTPNDRFYVIDTAVRTPQLDPGTWRLRIHGAVDHEIELTYDDLLAAPLHEVDATLACVSNEVGGDLVGTARWLGAPLGDLLDRAGVQPAGEQIIGRSADGWTAGFPTALAFDGRDALVAVGMNGEALPARHGFPARLLVPGLYGYVSATKWLTELELTSWEVDGYWVPRGWAKEAPIKTQSRIDVPARGEAIPAGEVAIAGVAWAPRSGIGRVEVRIDGGSWTEAEISTPLNDDTWVQWRARVAVPPGDHVAQVRATDADGRTQPERPRRPAPDGAEGWHRITFRAA